ncbi:hypothetical protein D9M69_646730 [compost metagenome]
MTFVLRPRNALSLRERRVMKTPAWNRSRGFGARVSDASTYMVRLTSRLRAVALTKGSASGPEKTSVKGSRKLSTVVATCELSGPPRLGRNRR